MTRPEPRCSAIWNGCTCGRAPHDDGRHVWMNTLDYDRAVDPAMYPAHEVAEPAGLDAAWKAAEAALPEGWSLLIGDERKRGKAGWWATASEPFDEVRRGYRIVSSSEEATLYDTPAAALLALAARLSESHP